VSGPDHPRVEGTRNALCHLNANFNYPMGYMLPSPDSPSERARSLMARKDALEAELEAQGSILKANNTDMRQPLVDREGYPRDDLDVWAVRHARVRIIELRNDLAALMDEIAKTLETVYRRSPPPPPAGEGSDRSGANVSQGEATIAEQQQLLPFARVNGVAPGSPAADAVRPISCGGVALCRLNSTSPCCARACKERISL
jgi:26S proteasome regulatory subunit N4